MYTTAQHSRSASCASRVASHPASTWHTCAQPAKSTNGCRNHPEPGRRRPPPGSGSPHCGRARVRQAGGRSPGCVPSPKGPRSTALPRVRALRCAPPWCKACGAGGVTARGVPGAGKRRPSARADTPPLPRSPPRGEAGAGRRRRRCAAVRVARLRAGASLHPAGGSGPSSVPRRGHDIARRAGCAATVDAGAGGHGARGPGVGGCPARGPPRAAGAAGRPSWRLRFICVPPRPPPGRPRTGHSLQKFAVYPPASR
jgi:hypothetical protein